MLNKGRVVERGGTVEVLRHPQDDYTVALLDALAVPGRARPPHPQPVTA